MAEHDRGGRRQAAADAGQNAPGGAALPKPPAGDCLSRNTARSLLQHHCRGDDAREDYAGSVGDCFTAVPFSGQPTSYQQGDSWSENTWAGKPYGTGNATGVIFIHSKLRIAEILDGTTDTFLVGEKSLNPDHYSDGLTGDDDQGWDTAFDCDNVRWTNDDVNFRPTQDTPGFGGNYSFGSAHAESFNVAFCDGSVQSIHYSIDLTVYSHLGDRKDGQSIDGKKF